jgi:uncharacterized protein (TIGR03067 family)
MFSFRAGLIMFSFQAGLMLILAGPYALAVGQDMDEATKAELKKLEGSWRVVSFCIAGTKVPIEGINFVFSFKGETMKSIYNGIALTDATIKINTKEDPKHLDVFASEGSNKVKAGMVVYKLEGDKLIIGGYTGDSSTRKRPKGIPKEDDKEMDVVVLKRDKTTVVLTGPDSSSQPASPLTVEKAEELRDKGVAKEVQAVLDTFDTIIDSLATPADVAKRVLAQRTNFEKTKQFPSLTQWAFEQQISIDHRAKMRMALHALAVKKAELTAELAPRVLSREAELRKKRLFDEAVAEAQRVKAFSGSRRVPVDKILAVTQTWEGEGKFLVQSRMPKMSAADPKVEQSEVKATVRCIVVKSEPNSSTCVLRITVKVDGAQQEEATVTCHNLNDIYGIRAETYSGKISQDKSPFEVQAVMHAEGLSNDLCLSIRRGFSNTFQQEVLGYHSSGSGNFVLRLKSN